MTLQVETAMRPIGYMQSCFTEKFGTPRQAGLVAAATGTIVLEPPFHAPEMVRGLEAYSHIWMIFLFHECTGRPWRPTVRPPRLGGNRRLGVLATRSGFRPNPIGMSAVALSGIRCTPEGIFIAVHGVDVIEGTPILDLKPYLPYADGIPEARAPAKPDTIPVTYSSDAAANAKQFEADGYPGLMALVTAILGQDPRPAYDAGRQRKKTYGMRIYDLNVSWEPGETGIHVTGIDGTAAWKGTRERGTNG